MLQLKCTDTFYEATIYVNNNWSFETLIQRSFLFITKRQYLRCVTDRRLGKQ